MTRTDFDEYAREYDRALAEGVAVSGESKEFFARGRVAWLARVVTERPRLVMDYGCGTGSSTPYLLDVLGAERVIGVDVSRASLEVARDTYVSRPAAYHVVGDFEPAGNVDLVFTNGVFHHIPVEERAAAVQYVWRALRPGGLFAFWENNPLNPGTRFVMSRCPFDDDAVMLSHWEASRLLTSAGFEVRRRDFRFFFPRLLSAFRPIEPALSAIPLGAQYLVLAARSVV